MPVLVAKDLNSKAVVLRYDWTVDQVRDLLERPLMDLLWQAQLVHRAANPGYRVQLASLLSVKTGGCQEDCAYCPQSMHNSSDVEGQPELVVQVQAVLERARAAKEAGQEIVKVKRKKFVQDHTDDCGEDMSSIGASEILFNHQWIDQSDSSDSGDELVETVVGGLAYTMLYGPCADSHCYVSNLQVFIASDVEELVTVATHQGYSVFDLAEVCGGQGRTSQLAVHRKKRAGENFDIVIHTDLANTRQAAAAYGDFRDNTVYVAVMAPLCDCFGPLSHLTWSLNYN
ncbi:MAG: hypothetical protein AB8B45_05415, partial [Prochlorococcus sp.]